MKHSQSPGTAIVKACATTLLLFFGNILPVQAIPPPSDAQSEWIFDCEQFRTGKYRFFVGHDAIKIANSGNGVVALAKGPVWRVCYFRDGEKLEWSSPLAKFDRSALSSLIRTKKVEKNPKYTYMGKEKIGSLKCLKYKLSEDTICWIPEELKASPQVYEIMSKYFDFFLIDGIPVKIARAGTGPPPNPSSPEQRKRKELEKKQEAARKTIPWLSVKNLQGPGWDSDNLQMKLIAWKKVPFKNSDFEYPKDYQRVTDLRHVFLSKQHREVLDDLIHGL